MTINAPINSVLDRMVTLSRVMDQALVNSPADAFGGNGGPQPAWLPALDAYETQQDYVVQLDLPGVRAEEVDVTFERNILTVRGTRQRTVQPTDKGETRIFFAEREWGSFARSLRFPHHVEGDRIQASFTDGVLAIRIPKGEAAKPRKIEIGNQM